MVVCEEYTYSRFKYSGGENIDLPPTGLSLIPSTSPRVDYNCLSVEDALHARAHFTKFYRSLGVSYDNPEEAVVVLEAGRSLVRPASDKRRYIAT
jgi:hypothetical protein